MPSWGSIDEQLNELSDRVGWVERLPKGEDRRGYAAFRLRPTERGGFMTYALQEEMASGFENLSRTNQFGPGWVLNSLNDQTLLMFFEQLPPNPSPELVTAVLLEMRATGRNEATFGPTLWAFSRATTNAGLHFLALRCLARTGFRTEENAGMLAKFPVSTNRSGFVSPLGIMATFRQLGHAGWPYLVYSLTNQISAVRRTAFEELALDWIDTESSSNWSPRFRLVLSSLFSSGVSFLSTNRLEFIARQSDDLRRAFVEQATEFFPSKPNALNAWDRTNAVVILSRFTNDPSPPIAARSLEALQKITAMPPAQ